MLRFVLVGLAVVGGLYFLHRVALWAEQRGWIYYRARRGSSGALGNALLQAQAIVEPSQQYVLEEVSREHSEEDEAGEPPEKGDGGTPDIID